MARRILMISPTPSHPQDAGNRARIYSLLTCLRDLGHEVSFLHVNGPQKGDDEAMRQCWGTGFYSFAYQRRNRRKQLWRRRLTSLTKPEARYYCGVDERYDPALDQFLKSINAGQRFDTVIVEYIFQSKALESFPDNTLKLIDTHDIFTDRHKMFLERGEKPAWLSTTAEDEAKALRRADVVIAIQDNERQFFSKMIDKPVVTVGHVVPIHGAERVDVVRGRMLFVASNSLANRDALTFILEDVWPRVRQSVPEAHLALVGSLCDRVSDQPGLEKLGRVSDLRPAYSSAEVVVNPLHIGTGLKIKTIEGLGHGKPLVTTSVGADGLETGIGEAFLVADKAADFATAVIGLMQNHDQAERLAQAASCYAKEQNQRTLQDLQKVLT